MKKPSAGILIYRKRNDAFEVLLGHPGGPFWAKKDLGAWSIPKGEFEESELPLDAAKREFFEETGQTAPSGEYLDLGAIKRKDGKIIQVWAVEGDMAIRSSGASSVTLEWPPKSGKMITFPEIDRMEWIDLDQAGAKMHYGQSAFVERLAEHLGVKIEPFEAAQTELF